ncbi:MAG: DUF2953 domain-containing protein [Lachnospiraceae bacterium]|nr:DUF2953 domain-containing protein [Lachnospiraceae bacterium]
MILSILKIIGIILLVIVLLLIFILGIVLFAPIRYEFSGAYKEKPDGDVLVKWAPILLKVTVAYHNGALEYVVRMFGGVVMTNTDAKISWIGQKFFSKEEESTADKYSKEKESKGVVLAQDVIEFEGPKPNEENVLTKQNMNVHTDSRVEPKDGVDVTSDDADEKKKKRKPSVSFKQVLTEKITAIRNKIQAIKNKVFQIIQKLKSLNEKREQLLKVYQSKRFDKARKDAIAYVKMLWRVIKPKKLEGYVHFGLSDPASTGQVLGVIAMFLSFYDAFLQIEPDFEQACFEGDLKGKGKFCLFPIIKLVIKVMLNKNLIKVVKKVQTIIEA